MTRPHRIIHDADCEFANDIVGEEDPTAVCGQEHIVRRGSRIEVREGSRDAVCTCGANPRLVNHDRMDDELETLARDTERAIGAAFDLYCKGGDGALSRHCGGPLFWPLIKRALDKAIRMRRDR